MGCFGCLIVGQAVGGDEPVVFDVGELLSVDAEPEIEAHHVLIATLATPAIAGVMLNHCSPPAAMR